MPDSLRRRRARWAARLFLFLLALYVFLGAIELFGHGMKMVGQERAASLFSGLSNPFAGLAVGILATAMVQSSSVTTSLVVTLVGSGKLPLEQAVPIVMGANIGTTITNILVSLGHITNKAAFRRAFAGATVHDMFNLLTVAILLPVELATGFLQRGAEWLVQPLLGQGGSMAFDSPIAASVEWFPMAIDSLLDDGLGLGGAWLAGSIFVLALALLIGALVVVTKNMRVLMADRIEVWMNRVLRRSGLLGLLIGMVITALVQSSSITTSLLVPMFGAGVLSIEAGFPIMIGANIGTTVTAILAATVTGPAGLTIALVHFLFNVVGTLIFFPIRRMRRVPIALAEGLAAVAVQNRIWVVVYIVGVFFVIPLLGILVWKC